MSTKLFFRQKSQFAALLTPKKGLKRVKLLYLYLYWSGKTKFKGFSTNAEELSLDFILENI